jgi:hypothetical protein
LGQKRTEIFLRGGLDAPNQVETKGDFRSTVLGLWRNVRLDKWSVTVSHRNPETLKTVEAGLPASDGIEPPIRESLAIDAASDRRAGKPLKTVSCRNNIQKAGLLPAG